LKERIRYDVVFSFVNTITWTGKSEPGRCCFTKNSV